MTATAAPPSLFAPSLMPSASEKAVRQSPYRASHSGVGSRSIDSAPQTDVAEQVVAFLRARHPQKTADNVAAFTGVPAGTVQKWLDRGSAPSARHFCCLIAGYGPSFLVAAFAAAPDWLNRAAREQQAALLKSEIAALEAKLAGVRI